MKAITYTNYGTPGDVLRFEDIDPPAVPDEGILVRIRAASVNPLDWYKITGSPLIARMGSGWRRPKAPTTPGVDFAGEVDAVGRNVQRFKPGDKVFGMRAGAFAEYICVSEERAIETLPANTSFEQAAAMPVAAGTALQALRDKGQLRSGQRVLINGASGGVGTFAVQIAKALGAEVTGVCSGRNVELVRSLGADRVIDYTREDFTRGSQRYDLVLDIAGSRKWSELKRILQPGATVVVIGAPKANRLIGPLSHFISLRVASTFGGQKAIVFVAHVDAVVLHDLRDLVESGKMTPVVDRRYPLSQAADAVSYVGGGHAPAKVVIST